MIRCLVMTDDTSMTLYDTFWRFLKKCHRRKTMLINALRDFMTH